jgi:hypothetical protein
LAGLCGVQIATTPELADYRLKMIAHRSTGRQDIAIRQVEEALSRQRVPMGPQVRRALERDSTLIRRQETSGNPEKRRLTTPIAPNQESNVTSGGS